MKIALEKGNVEAEMLRDHLIVGGNQVVDILQAEFFIGSKAFPTKIPSMLSGEVFNEVAMIELGYETSQFASDFFVSRYWNKREWGSQMFVGIPAIGLMNGGIGRQIETGCVGNWGSVESQLGKLFERPELQALLEALHHSGWVSLRCSSDDGLVLEMQTGVPSWGLFGLFEGLGGSGRLADFFDDPLGFKFSESWSISLLVSRWPWPGEEKTSQACRIGGMHSDVKRHFWLGEHQSEAGALWTRSTIVGVASAWGRTSWDANGRAVATCQNLSIPEVQYRTDIDRWGEIVWGKVREIVGAERV